MQTPPRADPPPYFFARGDAPMDDRHCIAVVGARAASEAGLRMAERLGFELAAKGFTNVREVEVMPENVRFGLPPEIVEAIAAAPTAGVSAD